MKSVVVDKIASVTSNCHLPREVKLGSTFPCEEGDVIAVFCLAKDVPQVEQLMQVSIDFF